MSAAQKVHNRSFLNMSMSMKSWGSRATIPTFKEFMKERRITRLGKVCLGFVCFSFVITTIMFVTPGWGWTLEIGIGDPLYEGEYWVNYGLWHFCSKLTDDPDKHYCVLLSNLPSSDIPTWWRGCQAVAVFGLVGSILSVIISGMYVFAKKFNQRENVMAALAPIAILTGLSQIALFISFCVQYLNNSFWCCEDGHQILEYHLYYCFVLCCVAAVLHIIVGVMAMFEFVNVKKIKAENAQYVQPADQDYHYQQRYY